MRRAAMVCLFLLVTVPLFSQEQGTPPEAVLHEILGLSDGQMNTLRQLEQARVTAVQPVLPQLAQAQQALVAALNADPADPAAVGKAMLAVRELQRQVEQAQHAMSDGFAALLTDAQKVQVEQIHAVETALRAAQALHAIGL